MATPYTYAGNFWGDLANKPVSSLTQQYIDAGLIGPTADINGLTAAMVQGPDISNGDINLPGAMTNQGYYKELGDGFRAMYDPSGKLGYVTRTSQAGDVIGQGLTGMALMALGANLPSIFGGGASSAVAPAASTGGLLADSAGTAAATGAAGGTGLTMPSLAAGGTAAAGMGGGTGLGIGAATDGVGIGATTAGGLSGMGGGTGVTAGGVGAAASGLPSLSSIASALKDNAGLVGAVGGALAGSQNSQQTTNATKEPWGPAQQWLKDNLGLGQQMQSQYLANPFSQAQKQAYNNSAALGNASRMNVGNILNQMGQRQAFNPRAPSTVNPYQFSGANLGFNTTTPFPGA